MGELEDERANVEFLKGVLRYIRRRKKDLPFQTHGVPGTLGDYIDNQLAMLGDDDG